MTSLSSICVISYRFLSTHWGEKRSPRVRTTICITLNTNRLRTAYPTITCIRLSTPYLHRRNYMKVINKGRKIEFMIAWTDLCPRKKKSALEDIGLRSYDLVQYKRGNWKKVAPPAGEYICQCIVCKIYSYVKFKLLNFSNRTLIIEYSTIFLFNFFFCKCCIHYFVKR